MVLLEELDSAVARLSDARNRVEELILERDVIIVDLIRHGVSKKTLAELTGMAPVSIYKILTKFKIRESSCQ